MIGQLFNAKIALGALILIGVAGATGYWKGSVHTRNALEAQLLRDEQIAQIAYDNAIAAAAEEIGKIEVVNQTNTRILEREIRNEPVYLDCAHPDDVVGVLNAILLGQAAPKPVGGLELPDVDATE